MTNYFKRTHYQKNSVMVSKQASIACIRLVYESKIFRSSPEASFPKLTVLFESRSCDMYLITLLLCHSPTFKFISTSVHFLIVAYGSICVKPRVRNLRGTPSNTHEIAFISLPKIVVQKNEKETNLIQRAYILT